MELNDQDLQVQRRLADTGGRWWTASVCARTGADVAGRPRTLDPRSSKRGESPGRRVAERWPLRTATPVINRGSWRYSATLSEFRPPVLNGRLRSVNRKVQGSSPCPGANFKFVRPPKSGHPSASIKPRRVHLFDLSGSRSPEQTHDFRSCSGDESYLSRHGVSSGRSWPRSSTAPGARRPGGLPVRPPER